MRVTVGSGGWYLCDWRDPSDYEYTELRGNKTLALQWGAQQLRGDPSALFTLRRLLGTTHPPRSDEQIAEEVARRLTSGAWVARRRRSARFSMSGLEQAEAGPAFPTEGRRSATPQRVSGPAPDLPLFPDDIDPAVIANAQKRAAALGIPFCEECLRAQLANR